MSLAALLAAQRLHRHPPGGDEVASLRRLIARDLRDAALPGLSADRTFATAYNAALQLCKRALACAGYRASSSLAGHHQTTIEAAGLVLGKTTLKFTAFFETYRRMRHVIDYDYSDVVTEAQGRELLDRASEFQALVEAWIRAQHPRFRL